MEAPDRPKFAKALAALGVAFGKDVDAAVMEAYWGFLSDLDVGDVVQACGAAGRSLKWFPKPAEIRELAGQSVEARAAAAWEIVDGAANRLGHVRSPDFGPRINAVVRNMGGWVWFCDQPLKSLPFTRKEFERVFGLLANTPAEALHGEPLVGSLGEPPMLVRGCAPASAALPEVGGSVGEVRRLVGKLAEDASGR